jgi:hypothetical protein
MAKETIALLERIVETAHSPQSGLLLEAKLS